MRENEVHGPYNFVSIPNRVLCRYADLKDVPRQDRWDPALCSGEIKVTLTADTPVFISNGDRKQPDFFQGADGSYQIPGSSLRGLIRENMQILGLGLVRPGVDFGDVTLYYRALADAKDSLKGKLKERYQNALGISKQKDGTDSPPSQVLAGYLHHEKSDAPGKTGYYILPAKAAMVPIPRRVKCKDKKTGRSYDVDNPTVAPWLRQSPFAEQIYYWYEKDEEDEEGKWRLTGERPERAGVQSGYLLSPGPMPGQNYLYLFPEEDVSADRIEISREDQLSYQEDYEARKNSLGGTERGVSTEEKERRKRFWALPGVGTCKPVFYCVSGGAISFSPSSYYLRVTYDRPLRSGLPEAHLQHQAEIFLDYPNAILGFTEPHSSLRSRVSFGDLAVNKKEKVDHAPAPDVVLGEPKLSFFPAYVREGKDYNQPDFRFRGYKQYWLHEPVEQEVGSNTRVQSALRPLAKGASFTGTIRYQNLYPDELGLLLWCLRLEEGCYQSIGMGKPYGYGRMKLRIDSLREYQPESLYLAMTPGQNFFKPVEPKQLEERVTGLIQCYQTSEWVKGSGETGSIGDMPHIREFFTIRSVIAVNQPMLSYMRISKKYNEYQNVAFPLGSIGELQEEMQTPGQAPSPGTRTERGAQTPRTQHRQNTSSGQQGGQWKVGTVLTGTTKGFTDALVFIKISGQRDQRVYFKNVPEGSYGGLEELLGYNRQVTIRLERIDPNKGPQWVIDRL